jgi:hypothetical protein
VAPSVQQEWLILTFCFWAADVLLLLLLLLLLCAVC